LYEGLGQALVNKNKGNCLIYKTLLTLFIKKDKLYIHG